MQTVRFPSTLSVHTPRAPWTPTIGEEFSAFLDECPSDARERIKTESLRVLGMCVKPGDRVANVGLVLGYVQSGKTLSFTGVSALAKDNGFRLVIIIGGVAKLLVGQTSARLKKDLRLTKDGAFNRWNVCSSPTTSNQEGKRLIASVSEESADPIEKALQDGIPLVVVMKHPKHLGDLSECLAECARKLSGDLSGISALIIDDEAHMYSPNVSRNSAKVSAIYGQLATLRKHLPCHSLLQYTATPQANLLTELSDQFAPAFVRLLGTGNGYAGGQTFFVDRLHSAIKIISAKEANNARASSFGSPVPPSLRSALASFLLVAANDFFRDGRATAHSMLVHSDLKNSVHQMFESWLTDLKTTWLDLLKGSSAEWDPQVVGIFKSEYDDLQRGNPTEIINFQKIMELIPRILHKTIIQLVNQSERNRPDFAANPYWIVNGGNQLGVGYTVEGLTTTHMLRKPGVGLSDTIQQRGRFFGYRGDRVKNCRVWLEEESRKAFVDYVEHEEALRRSLQDIDDSNLSLKTWRRKFILDPSMELTRSTAIKLGLMSFTSSKEGWISQLHSYDEKLIASNRGLIEEFVTNKVSTLISNLTARQGSHQRGSCSLADLLEFLSKYDGDRKDLEKFEVVTMVLAKNIEKRADRCEVIKMVRGTTGETREREVENGRITLHQGRSKDEISGYLGDANVHSGDVGVTLQIHQINLTTSENVVITRDAPFIALHLTKNLESDCAKLIIQRT